MTHDGWERGVVHAARRGWRGRRTVIVATTMALALVAASSCKSTKERSFEARAKVTKSTVNRRDAAGVPTVADVELSFTSCPGEVLKLVRGGADFAPCATKIALGTEVPIKLITAVRRNGRRSARVVQVGDCKRTPDPTDSRSYETIRTCEKTETDGIVVGFKCEAQPTPAMLAACPWLEQ